LGRCFDRPRSPPPRPAPRSSEVLAASSETLLRKDVGRTAGRLNHRAVLPTSSVLNFCTLFTIRRGAPLLTAGGVFHRRRTSDARRHLWNVELLPGKVQSGTGL